MERVITLEILPALAGRTVKTVLTREMHLSDGLIDDLKKQPDGILKNSAPARLPDTVAAGDVLRLRFRDEGDCGVLPSEGSLDIIYEDEDILLINKPAHMACHPVAASQTDTLANYLVHYYARQGQRYIPRIITRLDSGTSGIVLAAKNALSGSLLATAAAAGELKKDYLAVTAGVPDKREGAVTAPIRRASENALLREVCAPGEGQAAETRFTVLAENGRWALLRVTPLTGRTHQIRVHLASIGCPLAGDFLYGQELPALPGRFALHMEGLALSHPLTGAPLRLEAPMPEDMRALCRKEKLL